MRASALDPRTAAAGIGPGFWLGPGVVTLALMASCGSCPGSGPAETPPYARSSEEEAEHDANRLHEWPRWVAGHGEGRLEVVVGPLRAVWDHGRVEVAADRFRADILWATPADSGWIFLAADGAVAASRTFLGPLRHGGDISPGFRPARHSRGRLAIVNQRGALWTTEGTAAPARARLADAVLVAAFRDAAHGAAVTEDGRLMRTSDGGATWTQVDLGSHAAWDVELTAGYLQVQTSTGSMVLDASGALIQPQVPMAAAMGRSLSPAEDRDILAAAGTALSRPGRVLAGNASPLPAPGPSPWRFVDQRCSLTGSSTQRAPVHVDAIRAEVVRRVRLQRPGARGELAIWRADGNELRARGAWQGEDARGPFRGASRDSTLPVTQPGDDAFYPESTPYSLFGASRHGLVVERCADEQECDLLWIAHQGSIIAISTPVYRDGVDLRLRATAASDKGVVLWFTATLVLEARDPGGERREPPAMPGMLLGLDLLLSLAPDGSEQSRRSFVRAPAENPAGLARYRGILGYAAASMAAPDGMRFHALDTAARPLDLPGRVKAPVKPCARGAAQSAALIEGLEHDAVMTPSDVELTMDGDVAATVELGEAGACLRSLEAPMRPRPDNDHDLVVTSRDSKGLTGHFDEQDERFPIRCTPQ